ncbi:hypothetical protein EON65_33160 [archaeon]|nr:MAG: hypothetical protein EON65_33160 [archaeon]
MSDIDAIVVTLDSHQREHIAHALFWQDAQGDWPPVFQRITHQDVLEKRWVPRDSMYMVLLTSFIHTYTMLISIHTPFRTTASTTPRPWRTKADSC